ncbi:DUF4249 domain-containing protein [Desertivirga arenae]|uniref:DUF4249 domain-containing protein n=1 Tax=Desertivirga arenae TaxID=2810309 RepID=UPI001A95E458|nr:DUF4249 domain-containing protein [Pedobacter sp. SYSU D00823]
MKSYIALIIILVIASACRESFSPEVDAHFRNLLVVEGYLNIGDSTTFILSRTGDLKDWQGRIPEAGSRIEVQNHQTTVISGTTSEKGDCLLKTTGLNLNETYRIKITTKDGSVYQTDFLESKVTPEIDSISRRIENDGFKLYVSTHDPSNKARFYSWHFQETWEITTPFFSLLELKNGRIVGRDRSININRCWQGNGSSAILLSSTERLSEDRVSQAPLTFIKGNSIKLNLLYSILVKQYAHTREGYQYLEDMKKNTEEIGSIFDPQPSELKGNITCVTNPEEQVLGWIGAGTVTEKRIFIHRRERLPTWSYREEACESRDVPLDSVLIYTTAGYLIKDYAPFDPMKGPPTHATMTRDKCIDCRLKGSNVKPPYWPD